MMLYVGGGQLLRKYMYLDSILCKSFCSWTLFQCKKTGH
jgi:hypothetical protein